MYTKTIAGQLEENFAVGINPSRQMLEEGDSRPAQLVSGNQ